MEQKIVSLLTNNLRVIIPDFGAFIIRQQEPRIVVFNELLKNNDCLLVDYIMRTENMEADVAQQLLSDYTNQLLRTLDSGGTVTIESLGSLCRDEKGKIIFTPENATLSVETEPEPEPQTVTGDQLPFDRNPDPVKVATQKSITLKTFLKSQVAKWVAVILVANILVIAFFSLKDPVRGMIKTKKQSDFLDESVLNRLADSMMAAVKDTTVQISRGNEIPIPDSEVRESYRYYIVAGCFRNEINADELVDSLQIMGYKAEKFGKIGDLYAVSFASFDDKEMAVKELSRIRNESHPDAWMTQF